MSSEESGTRTRLLHAALKLFSTQGYHHTSIADILRESGCTRGSLYYYFSSKEELGYAAIDEALRLLVVQGSASHLQTDEHPIDRLLNTLDALPSVTELGAARSSATNITARLAPIHEGFRRRLAESTGALVERTEEMVRKGVADGQIADTVDPDQLSHLFVTVAMGMQFSRLLWEREVIWEDAKRWLKEYLNSLRR